MTAALEWFSGSPSDGDDAINRLFPKNCHRYDSLIPAQHYSPLKKWHRLGRNIAGAIAGFKNSFSMVPGNHLPEKLIRDIRRHLDLLPDSYSQSGFDLTDVVLHLRLVDQASDDDHPAVDIQQISGEPSVFKLTFACKSVFSLQTMYGAIEGSVLCCKKIQVFEKRGLTLGVVTVAVDPFREKHFKSIIAAELRSAAKKQRSSIVSLCHCHTHTIGEELGRWILSAGDMEFGEKAGINSFIGSYKRKKVWIKKLQRGNAKGIEIRGDLARLMSSGGEKNLLQFYGVCVDERNGICAVTPLMEGGSVRDLIGRRKKMRIGDVMRIGLQIAEGLLFVNSHGVSFRDLNSERILLDGRGNACLGDMGFVSACRNPWEATEYETGGYQWLAPEIIAIDPESKSETWMSNVYSFGMVLWEMVAGEAAYSSYSPVQAAVGIAACGLRPEIPKDCPPVLRSLMIRCWNKSPSKRPRLSEIVDILNKQTNSFNYVG